MSDHRLPPFASLLKSRDVEDPVNIYVHRPLAYGFVRLVHRTPITPNQVTLLAMVVGIAAGVLFVWGAPAAMVAGGVMLWASAILDGADGILARAKNMQSELGRALDGSADVIVAIATVLPGFYHVWVQRGDPLHLWLMVPAIGGAMLHIYLYDFYKESYLHMTRLDRPPENSDVDAVAKRLERLRAERAPWYVVQAVKMLLDLTRSQRAIVAWTNPAATRDGLRFVRNAETARIYRENNIGAMRLWAFISLCPHTYLMAICAMTDRLDVYLWIRLILMNAVFLVVLLWQRRASDKTLRELSDIGAAPVPGAQIA
jgi:phosphatidylglycerophosphate synthase